MPAAQLKITARTAVELALRHGEMQRPSHCSACGLANGVIEAHHDDYTKPLAVRWLCKACHEVVHSGPGTASVFGQRLREARTRAGLTQAKLARAADFSEGSISKYERGQLRYALPRRIRRLATALNVSTDWLLGAEAA